MKTLSLILVFSPITCLYFDCGNGAAVREPEPSENYPIVVTTDAFKDVLHDGIKRSQAAEIGDSLLMNYERIMLHLRIVTMQRVTISIWSPDHSDDFYTEMRNRIGQVYPGATGFTPSNADICLLWNPESPKASIHEFAHLVSMAVKPNIANNPRWLWEAVAQYESQTFDLPSHWSAADLIFPGFLQLNQFNSPLPYRWGYFIISLVIERWGDGAYINLIKSNGNIPLTIGLSEDEFGRLVEEYVKKLSGN